MLIIKKDLIEFLGIFKKKLTSMSNQVLQEVTRQILESIQENILIMYI